MWSKRTRNVENDVEKVLMKTKKRENEGGA